MDAPPTHKSRTLPIVVGGLGVLVVGTALAALGGALVLTHSSPCTPNRAHAPLTLEQLVDVKQRFERYRSAPDGGFEVSGEELAMLVEDHTKAPIFLELEGNQAQGQLVVPSRLGGCWAVDFDGTLSVDAGRARFLPQEVHVSGLDVSWYFRDRALELTPDDMPSDRAAKFLRQTHHAEVHAGSLQVELAAPEAFSLR